MQQRQLAIVKRKESENWEAQIQTVLFKNQQMTTTCKLVIELVIYTNQLGQMPFMLFTRIA